MSKSARRIVRNPITGEEIDYATDFRPGSSRPTSSNLNHNFVENNQNRERVNENRTKNQYSNDFSPKNPSAVPILNLDGLINESDRMRHKSQQQQQLHQQNPIIINDMKVNSARPKSSYRFGYDQAPLKSPIITYQQQLQLQSEAPKTNLSSEKSQMEAPRKEKIQKPEKFHTERIEDLQKMWLYDEKFTSRKVNSNENIEVDKNKPLKEQLVVDTVLTDQLSRFVLSEPEQEQRNTATRKMHNTAINPKNSLNENILNRRIKFSCRLRTSDGKNALRELFGILFLYDGSLTIYEFRQMCGSYFTGLGTGNVSKKANALPFINRKVYKNVSGRRKDKTIDLYDLFKGAILYIPLHSNELLNQTARTFDYYEIEITDINEEEKERLFTSQLTDTSSIEFEREIYKSKEKLKQQYTEIELNDAKVINSVQKFFYQQIETRSIRVYTGLAKLLKKSSEKMNNLVDIEQFHAALKEFNLQIHEDDLSVVWNVLDLNKFGYLSYYTLLRTYLGEMNQARHAYFRDLMHKLDPQKTGFVQVTDIHKFYKAKQHPSVKVGDITEKDLFEQFLSTFDYINPQETDFYRASIQSNVNSPLVTYEQFENFYNGLSLIIEFDNDFITILKNSWSLL